MKTTMAILLATATSCLAQNYHYQNGGYRQNGTYEQGHYQTNPNDSRYDNWSSRGNTNPITGNPGTVNPAPTPPRYGGGFTPRR